MFRPRVIPVLLLKGSALYKSIRFRDHRYIGDPMNAVRLFNDHRADELVFLDIHATREGRLLALEFVRRIGEEANMPFAVGGGIRTLEHVRQVVGAGAEKVIIGSAAAADPDFIRRASDAFGASTIAICIDVKQRFLRGPAVWTLNGTKTSGEAPEVYARRMEALGAGELIVQSIDHDGTMTGYDLGLIRSVSSAVTIPVVALGGAGSISDLRAGRMEGRASALAAGSLFVYHGSRRGVLINYPDRADLNF